MAGALWNDSVDRWRGWWGHWLQHLHDPLWHQREHRGGTAGQKEGQVCRRSPVPLPFSYPIFCPILPSARLALTPCACCGSFQLPCMWQASLCPSIFSYLSSQNSLYLLSFMVMPFPFKSWFNFAASRKFSLISLVYVNFFLHSFSWLHESVNYKFCRFVDGMVSLLFSKFHLFYY